MVDWFDAMEKLYSIGIRRLRFTGGEVFLHPGLRKICTHARSLGFAISFVTNGSMISKAVDFWLQSLQPESVWVSIYGYPEARYAAVSGSRTAFKRAELAILRLTRARINVGIYFAAGNTNAQEFTDLVEHFYPLGVSYFKLLQVLPHGRAAINSVESITRPELGELLSQARRLAKTWPNVRIKFSVNSGQRDLFEQNGLSLPKICSCSMGLQDLWTIDATGAVLPCCLFLNKGRAQLFPIGHGVENWYAWNTETVARKMRLALPVSSCPAISWSPSSTSVEEFEDFVCPLTFAELKYG